MTPHPSVTADSGVTSPYRRLYFTLLCVITAAYCLLVMSLPLFPSQDGPIHLYYTTILHDLLFNKGTFYSSYFTIKHILPPYSLYYYLLMGLAHFVSILTADKLIVCLYILLFTFGMRYLANALGSSGDIIALLSTPLLLNWPLAMGFVNYCLSTALALWALGLWCRSAQSPSHARRILFVLLAFTIMLTHPVPLLFLLGFCGLELAIRFFRRRNPAAQISPRQLLHDALYLAAAATTLIYVKIFTVSHVLAQKEINQGTPFQIWVFQMRQYALLHPLSIFSGQGLVDISHRLGLILLLFASLVLAIFELRRHRARKLWTLADTWTSVAIASVLGLPLVPGELNNSHYFAYRLLLYVWIAALIAVSGFRVTSRLLRPAAATLALLMSAQILYMAQTRLTPVARRIAAIQTVPPFPARNPGLMLHVLNEEKPVNLDYDPYFWAAAHFFRRTHSIFYNSPWLDLAIIAVGPQPTLPTTLLGPSPLEEPIKLRRLLMRDPHDRDLTLSHINFVLINDGVATPVPGLDPILAADLDKLHPWVCQPYTWYSLCQRTGQPVVEIPRPADHLVQ